MIVVEPRTYPGREFTASLRSWLPRAELASPPDLFAPWLSAATRPADTGEVALIPDAVKRGLEDVVLGAGVELIYAAPAVGLIADGTRIAGVVTGHKSGVRAVLARHVVDATDWGLLARLAAPQALADGSDDARIACRTLEFTGVEPGDPSAAISVVRTMTGVRDAVVHRGHAGTGHALVELVLDLPLASPDLAGRMAAEVAARALSVQAVSLLRARAPGFGRARLAQASWELHRISPWRRPDSDAWIPGVPGLSLLSSCAAPAGLDARVMLEPAPAARAGAAAADAVDRAIAAAPEPDRTRSAGWFVPGGGLAGAAEDGVMPPAPGTIARRMETVPELCRAQVLVAGGGTSGATAAAVAAGEGLTTVLLEMNDGLGGTGTVGGVDSYWFGRRVGFTAEVDRRVAAVSAKLGIPTGAKWNVEAKMHALLEWVEQAGCRTFFGCIVAEAVMEGDRIVGALVATPDGLRSITADVVVDASGDGDVAAAAGAAFTYGSVRDGLPMWYLLAPVIAPGEIQNGFTSAMAVGDPRDYTRAIVAGRRNWPGHDHMPYVAPRETRHIRGGAVLGVTDHLLLRRFPDTINICFANCDIKGRSAADWIGFGILPPNAELEIPYRAVVPERIDGLLIAGKAYSCTHDYLATARMQADLQNQGGAIALAAVQSVRRGIAPRAVDVAVLQAELITRGVLPTGWTERAVTAPPLTGTDVAALVNRLTGDEPFHLEQGFDDRMTEPLVVVQLCTAGPTALPVLTAAYRKASGALRLLLARILAWHGSREGVPAIVEAIEALTERPALPPAAWQYRHAGVPPDNGVMPEPCHLLHALALAPDDRLGPVLDRIVAKFDPSVDDFRDRQKGCFYYADEVCVAAERWGNPSAIPALQTLAGRAAIKGRSTRSLEPDFILDRLAYLELAAARALARCGSPDGVRTLIEYLSDGRALFVAHARSELAVVAGRDLGRASEPWIAWLEVQGAMVPPRPWTQRID